MGKNNEMKKVWNVKFKVSDPRLYGKGESVLSNFNMNVTGKMLPNALQFVSNEISRLSEEHMTEKDK